MSENSYMFTPKQLEKYALEKYPIDEHIFNNGFIREKFDINEKARKAFIEGYDLAANSSVQKEDERVNEAYYKGRKDALCKLPRWKKATRDMFVDSIDFAVKYLHDGGDYPDYEETVVTNRVKEGEYYIELTDLDGLSTE